MLKKNRKCDFCIFLLPEMDRPGCLFLPVKMLILFREASNFGEGVKVKLVISHYHSIVLAVQTLNY